MKEGIKKRLEFEKEIEEKEPFMVSVIEQLVIEERGMNELLRNREFYMLNHLIQMNYLSDKRDKLIEQIRTFTNMDGREIMEMVNQYFKKKSTLPIYTEKQKNQLLRANQLYNPIVRFEQVGSRRLGVVLEDEYYKVIDISEGKYNVMASSNGEGINWQNNNLDTPQMRWIMENLKELNKGVLL